MKQSHWKRWKPTAVGSLIFTRVCPDRFVCRMFPHLPRSVTVRFTRPQNPTEMNNAEITL